MTTKNASSKTIAVVVGDVASLDTRHQIRLYHAFRSRFAMRFIGAEITEETITTKCHRIMWCTRRNDLFDREENKPLFYSNQIRSISHDGEIQVLSASVNVLGRINSKKQKMMLRFDVLLLLLLAALPAQLNAYGSTGHRVVANLAWKLLGNETRNSILKILEPGESFYAAQMVEICGDNEDSCTPLGAGK